MNSTISDLTKKLTDICKKVATIFFIGLQFFFIVAIPVSAGFAINSHDVIAQATSQINYQGKLTNSSGVAVADGTYNMEFKLYTASTSGSLLWTETRTGTDKVQVTNGLFSVMLGSVTSLDSVDFNQPLYLGVNIGGTGSPSWDGEMAPRKTLGSVPSAFTAFTLEGLKKYQFLRSDVINSTSTASTYLKVEQAGAGGIAEFIANASSTLLGLYTTNGGQVTIGTSTANGTNKLTVIGNSYFSSSTFMAVAGGALNIGTSTQFGTNKLAVDGGGYFSGSVGIGTSTPQSKLVVVQGAAPAITISTLQGLFPSMRFERPGQITWDIGMLNSGNTNGNGFDIKDVSNGFTPFSIENAAPTGSLVVRASGKVGIGTTTPIEKLTIAGNASGIFLESGSNRYASIVTGNTTGALLVTAGSDNNSTTSVFMINGKGYNNTALTTRNLFGLQNNGSDVFTITSGGNIGVGTTSPNARIAVAGLSTLPTQDLFAVASSTNTQFFTIKSSGRVGVGSTTPTATFSVQGEGYTGVSGLGAPMAFDVLGGSANTGNGGSISLKGGYSNDGSTGGTISIIGGASDVAGGFGGSLNLIGGIGGGFGNGGNVNIAGGANTTGLSGVGGNVLLDGGIDLSSAYGNVLIGTIGGNLGVGSSTPGSKLSLTGDFSLTGALRASGNAGTNGMVLQTTGTGVRWVATSSLGISGGSSNYLTLVNGGLQTATSTDFLKAAYFTATSTTGVSTFAGYLGIGTTSPYARLGVVGEASSTGAAPLAIAAYGGSGGTGSGAGGGFLFTGGVGGSTNGPGGAFTVVGGAGNSSGGIGGAISLTGGAGGNSGAGGALILTGGSSVNGNGGAVTIAGGIPSNGTGGSIYIYGATPLSGTAGNVALGLTSGLAHSGNVGVGTTSPNAKFTVVGTSSLSVIFDVASSSNASILRVTSSGNVGIGTTSPSDKLSVVGDFNLTGALRANGSAGTSGMLLQTTGTGLAWVATSSLGIIGGSGTNYLSLGSGFIYTSTSTDYFKSAYFVATSTTATSTFASAIGIGTSTALATLDVYGNVILSGSNRYLTFGNTSGVSGYGFRDNAGALEYKNSGGSWSAFTAGGSGTPGGASGQVQFNDGGNFGADVNFTYDNTNDFLGLGTSTPGARLVVVGTTTADQIVIGGGTPFSNSVAHFGGNVNSYLQANIQNRSNGTTASSDFVASSDIGTDVANYVDFGINSSGFNSASFTIAGANEGYLYSQSSSLAIGVASSSASTSVKFFTGGTLAENERMRIDSTGNVGIGLTSPTEKLSVAGNILIGARADVTPTWTKRSNATAGTITTGGTSSIGTTSAMAVFNGSLYVGTSKGNGAEVYRYNGNNWTQVSSTTPGAIGTSTTVNIDTISSMAVWNGHLYIGTAETAAAEVYRYNGNSSWTKISSTTAGAIGGNSTTSAINSISAMVVHGGKMYIGTSKANGAEVVRYNGSSLSMQQTWTKVSNIATNAGTIGSTANVDAVTALVSYQGYMYAGTSEGTTGGLYRYDGQGTTGTGFTIIGTAGTFSGTGAAGASTVTGMGSVRTAAVYNGKLYLGLGSVTNGAGTGRVVKWDGNLTAGTNHELVSSSTAGVISEDIGATTGIDRIGAMAVYKDDLYVGTYDSTGIAEVYKLDGGNTWTKYSSTTAGTISTSTGTQTTAITGVLSMQAFNDDLWVGTEKATGAEVYSLNMTEGQSYDLAFEASSDNADAIQNGQKNKAWIQFQAEETTYNNAGNMNTGKFVFSHGINTVTGAYDLAEDYPTRDDMLAPGDLVSLDTKEKGYVRRAQGKNDKDIIGIYSVDPALRLSQKDPLIDGARAIPVALAGRVPVTVTLENGPIKIGDYLTSSAEPGKAAKATKPGRVIGRALGAYSGIDGEVPSVSVFLGTESISWNDLQNAADDATALAAGDDVNGIISVADFVDTVNTRAEDIVFALLNKADNLAIVIANNLTAITATIQDLFVKTLSILPGGSIALPSGENQIAGVGILSAGATDTFIPNTQIEEDSVIYLSPTSDIDTPLYVYKKVAGKGFSVRTKRAMVDTNITFDWFFIKTYKPKNSGDQVMTTVGGSSSSTDPTTITSVSTDTQNVTSSGNTDQQNNVVSGTENETGNETGTATTSQAGSNDTNSGGNENSEGTGNQSDSNINTVVAPEAATIESTPVDLPSTPVESPTAPTEPVVVPATPPEQSPTPVTEPEPTT